MEGVLSGDDAQLLWLSTDGDRYLSSKTIDKVVLGICDRPGSGVC